VSAEFQPLFPGLSAVY
jgi:hypothetical protein